jgi:hypothetical protein
MPRTLKCKGICGLLHEEESEWKQCVKWAASGFGVCASEV